MIFEIKTVLKNAVADRSIWWGLYLNNKPLALTQSYSAKSWKNNGFSLIRDLFVDNRLGPCKEISVKIDIPTTQNKTYNLLLKAIDKFSMIQIYDSNSFLKQMK